MRQVLVLGDSHSMIFKNPAWKELTPGVEWKIVSVVGATLSGLSNPNSKTGTHERFNVALKQSKADVIVTLMGEVDCGFVIWYYAERDSVDVKISAQKAIDNYKELLKKAGAKAPLFVISAPLPTIADGEVHGDVAQARSEIGSTQQQRTELTRWFNKQIKLYCKEMGYFFVDLDVVSMGKDGLVLPELKRAKGVDHHYRFSVYKKLLTKHFLPKLRAILHLREEDASSPVIRRIPCGLVDEAYLFPTQHKKAREDAGHCALAGVVMLKMDVAGEWRMVLDDGKTVADVPWHMPSPELAKRRVDNPNSKNARLLLPTLALDKARQFVLYLVDEGGERHALFEIAILNSCEG